MVFPSVFTIYTLDAGRLICCTRSVIRSLTMQRPCMSYTVNRLPMLPSLTTIEPSLA